VGDLIGMPVLDLYSKNLGYVRNVVRTPAGGIAYPRVWYPWPVQVKIEEVETARFVSSSRAVPPTSHGFSTKFPKFFVGPLTTRDGNSLYQRQTPQSLLLGDSNLFRWATMPINLALCSIAQHLSRRAELSIPLI
jgi:hypothetical protein